MRSYRHDEVVKFSTGELRKEDKWEVTVEERTTEGLKPDLIIRMKDKTKAWIIDPTIRMETTVTDIRAQNEEKERKCSGTSDELRAEGFQEVFVHGLWFGARGVISKVGLSLLRSLGINQSSINEIVSLILNLSHSMYEVNDMIRVYRFSHHNSGKANGLNITFNA
ncbi:hypothetical protein RvY_14388 [Ramazzottius varieornatus]|uniref:Uncharacterized protein n=1 Tax=Ramazzottius varieornatus TaxID=947166 RepID=A0A1D1VW75_RAMVA|nr:hypothetical protein RvY_14388 [Ramazzottius varieornatus]